MTYKTYKIYCILLFILAMDKSLHDIYTINFEAFVWSMIGVLITGLNYWIITKCEKEDECNKRINQSILG